MSALSSGDDKAGNPRQSAREAMAFSTDAGNPFRHYEPHHKQTAVFIQRLFFKWSYKDIAQANDMSEDNARKTYYNAVQKVLSIIIELDAVKKAMTPEQRKKADVAKQKRYLEKNREKVNAKRRERYARNKEKINAKRRAAYANKK